MLDNHLTPTAMQGFPVGISPTTGSAKLACYKGYRHRLQPVKLDHRGAVSTGINIQLIS
ncbi:MAG: hypothetical protein AAFW70_18680 [Cyanobacteria bacterium J06635_10]